MHRFFEDFSSLYENKIFLNKNNIKHFNVLRIQTEEEFEVVIDTIIYIVKPLEITKNEIICAILSQNNDNNESNLKINLYQGLPKSDKLELIIQKCTELGITKIIPFTSSRTVVKWDEKKEKKKINRYQEIAESAAKQSKRAIIPEVALSVSFSQMLKDLENEYTIVAYENRGINLRDILKTIKQDEINIVIGPEGGFSESEIKSLEDINAKIVNLGDRILRTETAAIALTAMIQYEIGDINK